MCAHKCTSTCTSLKIFSDCLICFVCILSNGEVIRYHILTSVVVIELSFGCLNTGPENRLVGVYVLCLCLTSQQQLRSYGDGSMASSLIRQTGEAEN